MATTSSPAAQIAPEAQHLIRSANVALTDDDHIITPPQHGAAFSCAIPTASRTISLVNSGANGPKENDEVEISRPATGSYTIVIKRYLQGVPIVTLPSATRATARLRYFDLGDGYGKQWHLTGGFNVTPGSDA